MQHTTSYSVAVLAIGGTLLLAGCGSSHDTQFNAGASSGGSGPYAGTAQSFPNPWNGTTNGTNLPPTQPAAPGSYGGSGAFTQGPDDGQAIVITYISTTSDGTAIKLMEMEILGQPLNMSQNSDGKTWTATDPTTGVKYSLTPNVAQPSGIVTDVFIYGSNGDVADVSVHPQKAATIPGRAPHR